MIRDWLVRICYRSGEEELQILRGVDTYVILNKVEEIAMLGNLYWANTVEAYQLGMSYTLDVDEIRKRYDARAKNEEAERREAQDRREYERLKAKYGA